LEKATRQRIELVFSFFIFILFSQKNYISIKKQAIGMQTHIGGQAIINGIMLLNKEQCVMGVKTKKGIKLKKEPLPKYARTSIFKIPIIRGFFQLILMLHLGIKAMIWSAEQSEGEKLKTGELFLSVCFATALAIGLFIILPFIISKLFFKGFFFNLIDGLLRIGFFIGYVAAIGRLKDAKEMFQYHGAEHKVVNCYEAYTSISLEKAQKCSTIHKRCGTAFIGIVLIVSIFLFSLIKGSWQIKLLSRIFLIPLVAGISYELLKLNAKKEIFVTKILIYPGLLIQRLTTKEPTESQLTLAVRVIKELIR